MDTRRKDELIKLLLTTPAKYLQETLEINAKGFKLPCRRDGRLPFNQVAML